MEAGLEGSLKPFQERASLAETRLAKLEALLLNKDGLSSGSETSSLAMKDIQSKLDTVSVECFAEKEKNRKVTTDNEKLTTENGKLTTENRKLTTENEKLEYRISHLIRAVKEGDLKLKSLISQIQS